MKKLVKIFLGATLVLFIFNACKKKEVTEPIKTTKQYLTADASKRWKLSEGKASLDGAELDLMLVQAPCVTDNILILSSDFKYQITEGNQKCKPDTDPDVLIAGNWALSTDSKSITIDKFIVLDRVVDKAKFDITTIDDNKFTGTTEVTINSKLVKMNVTFAAVDNV